jgi:hypothetical protein
MVQNNLMNEGELFCSDLQYKADDENVTRKYVGDGTRDNQDALLKLTDIMLQMKLKY